MSATAGYLTAREAAAYVGATYRGFDMWVRRHGIPCVRYGNRRRYSKDQLDRVLRMMAQRKAS
jgi:excisionase family DNA binding protein